MTIIEMKNVSFKYKKSKIDVLKNIDIEIEEGEVVAIVGSSNSGKSTLLKAMRGFIPHYLPGEFEGKVVYNNKDIADYDLANMARHMGYVFENSFIYETGGLDTVYDELEFPLENLGMKKNMMIVRIEEVLKYLDLYDLRYRNPKDLSPGERQMLSLAAVVAMDRNVIILDEPMSALDKTRIRLVVNLLKKLKEEGKTIVIGTKLLENIVEIADRVLVLDEGEIVLEETSQDILVNTSIAQYGVFPPDFIDLYKKLLGEGIDIKNIPLSIEDLERQLKNILKGVE